MRKKISNIRFYEKSFHWKRTGVQTDRQTDMTKLIVAFRNFLNASKKLNLISNTYRNHVCYTGAKFE